MSTHPTAVNAGLAVTGLRLVPRKRATSHTSDELAAVITTHAVATNGRKEVKCRQSRSPAEYGSGAARTTRLLQRMRDAGAMARRSTFRKRDAATDVVPAIEDQLHTLRPVCSAQRLSAGTICGAPAVAVAEIHAIDGCNQKGLTPDGDRVETLCHACMAILQRAMSTYVGDKCEMASRRGTQPVCSTCERPTRDLGSVFAVRRLGPGGLAS